MFESKLPANTNIIDDDTPLVNIPGMLEKCGLRARDYSQHPYGTVAEPLPRDFYIDEDEWLDRLEEKQRAKAGIRNLCESIGLDPLHQARTNFCWANGVVDCVQVSRGVQGQKVVPLSPASVACPITGFRNVGGYGAEAHQFIREHGIATQETWPPNAIDRSYDNADSRASREDYGIVEWYDVPPRDIAAVISLLLQDIPVATGHNWMRHLVTAIEPVYRNGEWGILTRNSGLYRDDTGHTVFMGRRGVPDDACCVRAALPSN